MDNHKNNHNITAVDMKILHQLSVEQSYMEIHTDTRYGDYEKNNSQNEECQTHTR